MMLIDREIQKSRRLTGQFKKRCKLERPLNRIAGKPGTYRHQVRVAQQAFYGSVESAEVQSSGKSRVQSNMMTALQLLHSSTLWQLRIMMVRRNSF